MESEFCLSHTLPAVQGGCCLKITINHLSKSDVSLVNSPLSLFSLAERPGVEEATGWYILDHRFFFSKCEGKLFVLKQVWACYSLPLYRWKCQ